MQPSLAGILPKSTSMRSGHVNVTSPRLQSARRLLPEPYLSGGSFGCSFRHLFIHTLNVAIAVNLAKGLISLRTRGANPKLNASAMQLRCLRYSLEFGNLLVAIMVSYFELLYSSPASAASWRGDQDHPGHDEPKRTHLTLFWIRLLVILQVPDFGMDHFTLRCPAQSSATNYKIWGILCCGTKRFSRANSGSRFS